MEDWAEIRRLHRAEGVPIKEIVRRLGVARNTVRAALRSEAPPSRDRGPRGSLADAVEAQVRVLLAQWPRMPATVIAERIGWQHSITTLKDRVRVSKTLVWDREAAIGGTGRVTAPAVAFAGTLATRFRLAPPRDPEFKGMVERTNGFLETAFLPGRSFTSPADFNTQLDGWLVRANARTVRSLQARPIDLLETDYLAMLPLPPVNPPIGLAYRIRLARDYYVRVDTVDYSVDPQAIGRFVDVTASPTEVVVFCQGTVVARHERSWAKHQVITDPHHQMIAQQMRRDLALQRHHQEVRAGARRHPDGHVVALRALPDYDALFGVDFDPASPTAAAAVEASNP